MAVGVSCQKYNSLGCMDCLKLGYMWCDKYTSPFASTFCDASITQRQCGMLVAENYQFWQCNDQRYNRNAPPPAPKPDPEIEPDPVPEPEKIPEDTSKPSDFEDEPPTLVKYNHQYVGQSMDEVHYYMLWEGNFISNYKTLMGSCLLAALLGFAGELARFMKWYIVIRKRVTNNCLQPMLKNVKSLTEIDGDEASARLDHLDEFELTVIEKMLVTIFFFANRGVQLICAIQVMLAYHTAMIVAISLGMAIGNFIFAGLVQDQVLINRIRRETKMRKVLVDKITQHNEAVTKFCETGVKSLVTHWKEPMSLQKI